MGRHASIVLALTLVALGCGGGGSLDEQVEAVVDLDPNDPTILMRPFSAEEIRDEWVPGFRLLMRRSFPEQTLIERWTVVSADDEGVEIEHATIADDTGLEVDALGGRPGVHTARFAGPEATYAENRRALLDALDGRDDRTARFRTVMALVDPGVGETTVEGVLEGSIATSERGDGGFGYDSIFDVGGRTLAEIPESEKNRISHRAVALHSLAALLAGVATEDGRTD